MRCCDEGTRKRFLGLGKRGGAVANIWGHAFTAAAHSRHDTLGEAYQGVRPWLWAWIRVSMVLTCCRSW